jgi:predicted  nucleic acid-binding Zn-ribbon protein
VLEGLDHLLELQRLDAEITTREEALAALPGERKRLGEAREAAANRLSAAHEARQEAESGQRKAEAALQDQEALLKRLEGQQFQVKDNTAYTALLSEMDHANELISQCETRILEGMEEAEACRAVETDAQAEDHAINARVESEEQTLSKREETLRSELEALRAQRDQVGPKLDAKTLSLYERVASRRRPALALVSGDMCEGCRVGIPAQNTIEIMKGERLITCGNCQRILLHPDMVKPKHPS